ncbi:MAG: hypothetical protein Roseis2KO_42140 [Roseivirga sp.]
MAKPKSSIAKFLFELFIVFIGVYGAFELNRYQESLREKRIKESYFKSFQSELSELSGDIKRSKRLIDQRVAEIDTAMANAERFLPRPLNLYFDPQMLITRAGFNDDVFTQLGAGLSTSLSGGFENVRKVSQMTENFNIKCNMHLIASSPISFFDRNDKLKPQFQWYVQDLKALQSSFAQLSGMIENQALPATRQIVEDLR